MDRAVYLFYTGDFPAAQAQLARLDGQLPAQQQRLVEELTAEANAAIELLPNGGEWREISGELSQQAYNRGKAVLIEHGPEAARPWFALALSRRHYSPMELSLYMYCRAALDGDEERMHVLREHILQFGVDRELARALGV